MSTAKNLLRKNPVQQCANCKFRIAYLCKKTRQPVGWNDWCGAWKAVPEVKSCSK